MGKKAARNQFCMTEMNCDNRTFGKEMKLSLINQVKNIAAQFENLEIISLIAVLAIPVQDSTVLQAFPAMLKSRESEEAVEHFNMNGTATEEKWARWIQWLNKQLDILSDPRRPSILLFLAI